jgi:hypothetical protein
LKTLQPQGLKPYKRINFRAEIVTLVSRKEEIRFFVPKNHHKNALKSHCDFRAFFYV